MMFLPRRRFFKRNRENDIVVDGEGLIGKVKETGGNWAKVVSVLNE
jgi:cell shape-determining protein MreC